MLRRNIRNWKQNTGYGAIADAFRCKYLKMLENFAAADYGAYATDDRNSLNKSAVRQSRALADQAGMGRVTGRARPLALIC
jgi:hypothetical protein